MTDSKTIETETATRARRLTLLRHGRAQPAAPGLDDFERPLIESGRRDVRGILSMDAILADLPDVVLSSTGLRALETAQVAIDALGLDSSVLARDERLYLASAETLHNIIAEQDALDVGHVMIVGHNPGLEILAGDLDARAMSGLPTAGLYRFARHADNDAPGGELTRLLFEARPPRSSTSDD